LPFHAVIWFDGGPPTSIPKGSNITVLVITWSGSFY
jgi:hypothetical protein